MRVRIGVTYGPQPIDVEVDDAAAFIEKIEQAFGREERLLSFTDLEGRTVLVPLDKLAYLEVEPERPRLVGFAKGAEAEEG